MPGNLIGACVQVRADSKLVRIWHRGQLVKTHPRQQPGRRSTDPADLPGHKTAYAMRDIGYLQKLADDTGPAVGAYAAALPSVVVTCTRVMDTSAGWAGWL